MKDRLFETKLTIEELERYPRQAILPEIGVNGQIKIRNSSVLVVGLGGLGSPVIAYLSSCGISSIGLVDGDKVDKSNIQRQIIYKELDIGNYKVDCAINYIKSVNNSINVTPFKTKLTKENSDLIMKNFDIIADCTDDIECRYLISEYCELNNKSVVLASVLRWAGQVYVFPGGKPCYRCLFPEKKEIFETCDEAGVVGSVCGIIGSIQATEILKMVLGISQKSIIIYDALKFIMKRISPREANNHSTKMISKEETKRIQLNEEYFITWDFYLAHNNDFILVDNRKKELFELSHIKNSLNIQSKEFSDWIPEQGLKVAIVCKRGISSQKNVLELRSRNIDAYAIKGGLKSFKDGIENDFIYY